MPERGCRATGDSAEHADGRAGVGGHGFAHRRGAAHGSARPERREREIWPVDEADLAVAGAKASRRLSPRARRTSRARTSLPSGGE